MKAILIKIDEERAKYLGRYQAKKELETGVRPKQADVFFEGLECLNTKVDGGVRSGAVLVDPSLPGRLHSLKLSLEERDEQVKVLNEENKKLSAENARLRAERKSEENPSLAASECLALRKKVAELEAQLKAKPGSTDDRQVKMLTDAAIKADEEIARLKAEIVRKDHWFETTPMDDKAEKDWVMYYQLKKSMAKGSEFDQEAGT